MNLTILSEIITSLEELKPWQRFAVAHVDELIAYLKDREREMRHQGIDDLVAEAEHLGLYEARN